MVRVLISYRRDDSAPYAGRIYDSLCERLGRTVFLDIDSIEPGEDFPEKLQRTLESCHAVLAVIGPRWLSASDAQGRQRLRLEDDYVRLEVAEALRKGLRVIPVLVGGAELPKAEELPEDLRPLVRRQAVEVSHQHYREDVARLSAALERLAGRAGAEPPRLRRYAAVPALGVLALGGYLARYYWPQAPTPVQEGTPFETPEPKPEVKPILKQDHVNTKAARSEKLSDAGAPRNVPVKEGMVLVYASAQNGVALERPGERNSIFTKHFLKVFDPPDVEFARGVQEVTDRVVRDSAGLQEPWIQMTYKGGFTIHPDVSRKRIALVIGNRSYEGRFALRSSNADARDIAALLERGGFGTDVVLDATLAQTRRALSRFERAVPKGLFRERLSRPDEVDVALLYYSGHAFAQSGSTYILPVDFDSDRLQDGAVPEDEILGWLNRSGAKLKIAIFDACRSAQLPLQGEK